MYLWQEPINECNAHEPTLEEARKWNEAYEKGYSLGYENGKNERKPAEWSEEDEKMVQFWNMYYEHKVGDWPNKDVVEHLERFKEWLNNRFKSLRPQPHTVAIKDATKFGNLEYERGVKDGIQSEKSRHWKPSEEQMDALHYVKQFDYGGHRSALESLYNDIKNL